MLGGVRVRRVLVQAFALAGRLLLALAWHLLLSPLLSTVKKPTVKK